MQSYRTISVQRQYFYLIFHISKHWKVSTMHTRHVFLKWGNNKTQIRTTCFAHTAQPERTRKKGKAKCCKKQRTGWEKTSARDSRIRKLRHDAACVWRITKEEKRRGNEKGRACERERGTGKTRHGVEDRGEGKRATGRRDVARARHYDGI